MVHSYPIVFLLILGVDIGFVLPFKSPWMKTMIDCATEQQAPSLISRNTETWLGKARYNISYGVITLQIEEIQKEKNCFASVLPHLSETISTINSTTGEDCLPVLADLIPFYLFNDTKCFFAEYNNETMKQLPPPTECLMNLGNTSDYVPCNNSFNDGCQKPNATSKLMITLSFPNKSGCWVMKDNKICQQIPGQPVNCSFCLLSLIQQYADYLIGLGCIVVILHILCICCCLRCQIKRQLSAKKEKRGEEPSRRPRSETIERIYINRDLSSQKDTYDIMTDMDQSSDTNLQILQKCIQDYDIGISRSAKSNSGDYDLAWAEGSWSAAGASPHVDYARVEIKRKQKMDTVLEEEIYSKQKLSWEDEQPCRDIQKKTKETEVAGKKHKKLKTEGTKRVHITDDKASFNAPYEQVNIIRDKKQRFQTEDNQKSCDNVYSTVKISGINRQNTQEEIQRKNEKDVEKVKHPENGSCINKTTNGVNVIMCKSKQDKLGEPSVKKKPNKDTPKNPRIQIGSGIKRSMNFKVDTQKKRPMEELYNDLTDDTIKTPSPEKEELVDEGTIVLRANMNKVVMETKL